MGGTKTTNGEATVRPVTAELSKWIANLSMADIPPEVIERAKYQLLDGVACALVGAHVPWSERYVEATAEYEPVGDYSVIGWDKVSLANVDRCLSGPANVPYYRD